MTHLTAGTRRQSAGRIAEFDRMCEAVQHNWSARSMERLLIAPLSRFPQEPQLPRSHAASVMRLKAIDLTDG